MKRFLWCTVTVAALAGCQEPASQAAGDAVVVDSTNWALLPFVKVDSVNPVLQPGTGSFMDPIWKKTVAWEEKDVFNPAVVVRGNKLYLLYRAQDKVGK